jgi:hypothetical protein
MAEKQTGSNEGGAAPARINKMQAVRDAMKKLGNDASAADIQKEVKKRTGVEMTTKHIGTYKADILRKAGKETGTKSMRPAARETPAPTAPARAARNGKGSAVEMNDILTLKDLVKRVGAEHLHTLINVMAR